MSGNEMLSRIRNQYPQEKPIVFNYAQAREKLLYLAGRVTQLESLLAGTAEPPNNGTGGKAA